MLVKSLRNQKQHIKEGKQAHKRRVGQTAHKTVNIYAPCVFRVPTCKGIPVEKQLLLAAAFLAAFLRAFGSFLRALF